MFEAFRGGKSFEGMRENLTENDDYKSGRGNRFIFPDEAEYKRQITSIFKIPVETTIKITDEKNRPYSLESN